MGQDAVSDVTNATSTNATSTNATAITDWLQSQNSTQFLTDFAALLDIEAEQCGITLETTPCTNGLGVDIVAIGITTRLSGITAANFDAPSREVYKQAVADTANQPGVTAGQVLIIKFADVTVRRDTELEVNSQVILAGSETENADSIVAALSNTATFQAAIEALAAGTNMAGVTVTSNTVEIAYSLEAEDGTSSSDSDGGL